jgi:two-component system response regulator AtoC
MSIAGTHVGVAKRWNVPEDFHFMCGTSAAMRALEEAIANVASSRTPVLIVGESGSGKRAVAYRIHQLSGGHGSFQELNCAEVSADEFSEVGPDGARAAGLRATLLLTEIGGLSANNQNKLLSELLRCEGADAAAAARIIASSRHNLEQDIRAGKFREDLYYRLSSLCLRVPPLRLRREDIPQLSEFFAARYATQFGRPKPTLKAAMLRFLSEYSWPGNVRQLEDAVRTITAIGDERLAVAALRSALPDDRHRPNGEVETISLKQAARAASRQAERELILKVLSRTRWNRKRAAEELRISYKALLYKLKQIGVDEDAESATSGDDV